MKLQGQSIKLFVIESLKKLKTAELSNWIGKAYIGERKHSKIIQDLPDLQNKTGIYLLLSNKNDETQLYIGEYKDVLITNKDLYFKSPSAASDTVKNISTNGRKEWKLENGKTLDEFESESI